jgi:hypothetical protein
VIVAECVDKAGDTCELARMRGRGLTESVIRSKGGSEASDIGSTGDGKGLLT